MIDAGTLARIIDTQGLVAAEPHMARIAGAARRRGINTISVDVLTDRAEPEVARLRALARVQRDLAYAPRAGSAAA